MLQAVVEWVECEVSPVLYENTKSQMRRRLKSPVCHHGDPVVSRTCIR